jgi:hypothetical protein
MTTHLSYRMRCAIVATIVALGIPAAVTAQESRSVAIARELTALFDTGKLEAFAAKDASQPDRYVAALYFPGVQLLVVSARYQVPVLLDEKIGQRNYRDVYIDLGSAFIRETKDFVEDLGANGLLPKREGNQPFDMVTLTGGQFTFDGDYKKQKLTQEEYQKAFAMADEKYAKMLSVLLAAARKHGS